MAVSRRRELDISRGVAAALGQSAVEATRKGLYVTSDGEEVVWRDAVQKHISSLIIASRVLCGGSSMRRGRANLEVDKSR